MFFLSDVYFQKVESARVILFYGQVGSYKTLSAVATAYSLLKTKRYQRVYANIPVMFASSPPLNIDSFDFLADYAANSIFIIDEAALFLTGKSSEIKEIFAFPRKLNQVFLLASVLPVKQIKDYCHYYVTRDFNYSMVGLPIMSFRSGELNQRKQPKHWIVFYSKYFSKYSSRYRPDSMLPIDQWRDRGVLYDVRSNKVPSQVVEYFELNSWGLAEKRSKLTEEERAYVDHYVPEFDTDYIFETEITLPKLKKKRTNNPIGTEFNFGFFLQFALFIYLAVVSVVYFSNMTGKEDIAKFGTQHLIAIFTLKNVNEVNLESPIVSDNPQIEQPQVIEWKIEEK